MAEPELKYERLSSSRLFLNGWGTLWLGPDHILQVTALFGTEWYRRWYFSEIQAVILRKTATRMIWTIVLALISGCFFLGALATFIAGSEETNSGDRAALYTFSAVAAFLGLGALVILIVNITLGPSCRVHVRTPHGIDKLAGPTRVPSIEKILARIRPQVETLQTKPGDIGLREIAASLDQPVP